MTAMSDVLVLEMPATKKRAGKVRSVLRVIRGGLWVGDILLDRRGRVWRHVPTVPSDVVLKVVAAFTRGEEQGELLGRRDGLEYEWSLVGAQTEAAGAVILELAEAA